MAALVQVPVAGSFLKNGSESTCCPFTEGPGEKHESLLFQCLCQHRLKREFKISQELKWNMWENQQLRLKLVIKTNTK